MTLLVLTEGLLLYCIVHEFLLEFSPSGLKASTVLGNRSDSLGGALTKIKSAKTSGGEGPRTGLRSNSACD